MFKRNGLASRGLCPLETKALQAKAAGAIGIILGDNRQGEANFIPISLGLPAGMIANLDASAECKGNSIRVDARADGSFDVTNGRNGVSKTYKRR